MTPLSTIEVEARDESYNTAETELTIVDTPVTPVIPTTPSGISLYPPTSHTSPGRVGMELTVDGAGFIANATVTITYSDGKAITVATTKADGNGNLLVTFSVPPSLAGDHIVTCTDGTNSATSNFTMESEAPPIPVLLLPQGVL